jgi:hypothetical protein
MSKNQPSKDNRECFFHKSSWYQSSASRAASFTQRNRSIYKVYLTHAMPDTYFYLFPNKSISYEISISRKGMRNVGYIREITFKKHIPNPIMIGTLFADIKVSIFVGLNLPEFSYQSH